MSDIDLVPEFLITEHAKQRMAERIKVSPRKMEKLCAKAWYGKSIPIPKLIERQNRADYFYHYRDEKVAREVMGYVFIFGYGQPRPNGLPRQKKLITVV
jgi:hypothetical protein